MATRPEEPTSVRPTDWNDFTTEGQERVEGQEQEDEERAEAATDTDEQGGQEQEEEDHTGETMCPKTIPRPVQPTRAKVKEPEAINVPFRNWCPHCVRGEVQDAAAQEVPT